MEEKYDLVFLVHPRKDGGVWIEAENGKETTYQHKEELKRAGFHWDGTKWVLGPEKTGWKEILLKIESEVNALYRFSLSKDFLSFFIDEKSFIEFEKEDFGLW